MAEFMAAVFAELAKAAVVTAVGKVSAKLNNEVLLISHFAKDIRQLQRRLITLQSYLNDADRALQTQQSDLVKQWIRDLWDSTMEAQELVDICAAEGLITHASPSAGVKSALFRYAANLIPRRRKGLEIRNLDARLNEIEKRASVVCHMQQITASSSSSQNICENPWRRSDVLHDEETSVDISPKMEEVICLARQYRVVAVVGMGGSGKTRLLQHVYGSMKSNFEVSIWLSVSQTYTVQQLQFDVLTSIGETPSREESQESRERKVHDALLTKRNCLMVLDDVWELTDNERGSYLSVLEKLRRIGFPETPHCKILVSTRDRLVALQLQAQVYSMPLLSYEKSQELFLKHVGTPQHFSEDGSVVKILKRCGGLPLAIVAVAGILKHQDPGDWNHTLKQMETGIFHDPQSVVITALRLSYNALQPKAKSCFGFLGMFREDERIHSEKLIGMWKGEGLVQNHEDGFAVLQDLANRCLIELNIVVKLERVGFRFHYDYVEWEVCYVRVHDMVHDVAVSIFKCYGGITDEVPTSTSVSVSAEEEVTCPRILRMSLTNPASNCPRSVRSLRLVQGYRGKVTSKSSKFLESARALRALDLDSENTLHNQYMDLPPCVAKFKLQTFLDIYHWFGRKEELPESIRHLKQLEEKVTSKFLGSARALRALDLQDTWHAWHMDLPPCVAKFKLLTFLDISRPLAFNDKLPKCIRHLKQLEYLYAGSIRSVPTWIGDLKRLTHLSIENEDGDYSCSEVNKPMKNLRVLRGVVISIGDNSQEEDAASLSFLPTWTCTWNSLSSHFPQLQELYLELSRFQTGQTPPPCLHSLVLSSRGGTLTLPEKWPQCLERLQTLALHSIELPGSIVLLGFQRLRRLALNSIFDIAVEISKLPELMHLYLNLPEEVVLPEEYGRAGAFPKLRSLSLDFRRHLRKLPSLEDGDFRCHLLKLPSLENRAMLCLRSLKVRYCTINEAPGWKEKVCSLHQFEWYSSDGQGLQEMKDAFENRTGVARDERCFRKPYMKRSSKHEGQEQGQDRS